MSTASVSRQPTVPLPRRLLAAAGDDRLVEQLRRRNQAAFEVIYDRYHRPLLGYCRHLVGSVPEAEDALQQAFVSAYRSLTESDRPIALRPWLYTIARNTCISHLRSRREESAEAVVETASSSDEAERRADVRELVRDVAALPEDQRSALVLSELGDLSHEEVATAIGCERMKVKSLVHQARQQLSEQRRARETPCEEVREQLSTLRGGSLRRAWLQVHLRTCEGCRAHRQEVRRQRSLLALTIPIPSAGLRDSVLGAVGPGGGAGGGSLVAGSAGASGAGGGGGAAGATVASGAAASGSGAAASVGGGVLSSLGASAATKLCVGVALAGGAAAGGGLAARDGGGPDGGVAPSAETVHTEVARSQGVGADGATSTEASTTKDETTTDQTTQASSTATEPAPAEPAEPVKGERASDDDGHPSEEPSRKSSDPDESEDSRGEQSGRDRASTSAGDEDDSDTRQASTKDSEKTHDVSSNVRSAPDPTKITGSVRRSAEDKLDTSP